MEIIQWLLNALTAAITRNTSIQSKYLPSPINDGASNVAPNAPTQDGLTTQSLKETTSIVRVKRLRKTSDAILGRLDLLRDGCSVYSCDTLENLAKVIDPGEYDAKIDLSPHLGYRCPHLAVPSRDAAAGGDAGIRVHVANYPAQLEGCIGVGTNNQSGSLDNSKAAFDKLLALLPQSFKVLISE